MLYEALTFKLGPTGSWVEHFSITYAEKLLLFQAVSCCGHHTGLVIRGTWAKIPLGAITVFSHKLSSVEFPLTFYQFLLNLDCESICDPPGGDSVVGSRDLLHCLLTFNYPCPPVNHSHVNPASSHRKTAPQGVPWKCHTLSDIISHVASMVVLIVKWSSHPTSD